MGTSERPPRLRLFTEGRALDIKKLAGRKVGTCVETEPVKKKKRYVPLSFSYFFSSPFLKAP